MLRITNATETEKDTFVGICNMMILLNQNAIQLERIKNAKDALDIARSKSCSCSGFSLQYDGCMCSKSKEIIDAKYELGAAINSIVIKR